MNYFIKKYIEKMSIRDFNQLCFKNDIHFSKEELEFSYAFIKNHYLDVTEKGSIDITPYQNHFSLENYQKIKNLINEYQDTALKYLKK